MLITLIVAVTVWLAAVVLVISVCVSAAEGDGCRGVDPRTWDKPTRKPLRLVN